MWGKKIMGLKAVPEINVVSSAAVPINRLVEVAANGTVALADDATTAVTLAGVSVNGNSAAGDLTIRLLSTDRTHLVEAGAAVTDLTVPLQVGANGKAVVSGDGAYFGMPLHTCANGEYVEFRAIDPLDKPA